MSENSSGIKDATGSLGDHTDGVEDGVDDMVEGADATNTDATNDDIDDGDNIDRDANGTNTPQIDNISNEAPVLQETSNGNQIPMRQVDWDARCPVCGRFSYDTDLLIIVRTIAEMTIQIHGMEDAGERCPWCRRLWVYCDHQERSLEADNDPVMVRSELDLFTDLEQLASGPVAPFLASLFGAISPPDVFDEGFYGTSGCDTNDETESKSSDGDDESDSE